jgi:hypothetical protein
MVWLLWSVSVARLAFADEWTFTVDPQLSQLEGSGQFAGVTLVPQDAEERSSIASVSGWVIADLDDANQPTSITLMANSLVVADSGDWLPSPMGGPALGEPGVPTPANFALWFDDPGIGQGWGAVRDLEVELIATRAEITGVTFPTAPLIDTLEGVFDYNVPSAVLAEAGQEVLRGEILNNEPEEMARFRLTEHGAEITHPIRIPDFLSIDLLLEGQIVARVEFPWRLGDFDEDGTLSAADIDLLSAAIRRGEYDPYLDLTRDGTLDESDREVWVHDRRDTYYGDADLNGRFESGDLVVVLTAGEYEDEVARNSNWKTGDWNNDAEFSSSDLVLALQDGGYELGARLPRTVPEVWPALSVPLWGVTLLVVARRRRGGSFVQGLAEIDSS